MGEDRTAVASKFTAVEFLGQNHGRPAEIRAVLVNRLSEGELCWGQHTRAGSANKWRVWVVPCCSAPLAHRHR